MKYLFIALNVFLLNIALTLSSELARGFNDNIDWVSLDDGLKSAKESGKPIFILIHKSWCGACKALKPKFATDRELETLSKDFVMINLMDDELPMERQYQPDGEYIPRILFMNSAGEVQNDLINEDGNNKYKYFYADTKQVVKSMRKAKDALSRAANKLK